MKQQPTATDPAAELAENLRALGLTEAADLESGRGYWIKGGPVSAEGVVADFVALCEGRRPTQFCITRGCLLLGPLTGGQGT